MVKCKGKVKSTNRWITGYHVALENRHFISLPLDIATSSCIGSEDGYQIEMFNLGPFLEVLPETVRACTNKRDKNGALIYDKDIVKVTGGSNYFGTIEFDEACGCYFIVNHDVQLPVELSNISSKSLEVAGNVFDTRDLLCSRSAWR